MFTEIKHHKNKATQTFTCELLHKQKDHIAITYFSQNEALISDIKIPARATTFGYYWSDKNYVLWKIVDSKEKLISSLFHICKDVAITETSVSYMDLILDIWVYPDNSVKILDEDELKDAKQKNLLNNTDNILIENTKNIILSSYTSIINSQVK